MLDQTILALDVEDKYLAISLLDKLTPKPKWVKVGMELFYREGKPVLDLLLKNNYKIFLDLKLHDIPNTVERAIKQLAPLGIGMLTIHASGGSEMMRRATNAVKSLNLNTPPKILGITQLTSISQEILNHELYNPHTVEEMVAHFASLCLESGLDGVVCSPLEVSLIRQFLPPEFLIVTPGVRLHSRPTLSSLSSLSNLSDQKRVASPQEALQSGAHFIVVGREISQSPMPNQIWQEFCL